MNDNGVLEQPLDLPGSANHNLYNKWAGLERKSYKKIQKQKIILSFF